MKRTVDFVVILIALVLAGLASAPPETRLPGPAEARAAAPPPPERVERFSPRTGAFAPVPRDALSPGDEFLDGDGLYRVQQAGAPAFTGATRADLEVTHRPYDRERSRAPESQDVVWLVDADAGGTRHVRFAAAPRGALVAFQGRQYRVVVDDGGRRAEATGLVARRVTGTFVHPDRLLWELTLRDAEGATQTLTGTSEHPFFVPDENRYVALSELRPGQNVLAADGTRQRVTSVRETGRRQDTFNLEVEGSENYFVVQPGATGGAGADEDDPEPVLVHNTCFRQVAYGSTRLSRLAQRFRLRNGITGGRNVAVFRVVTRRGGIRILVASSARGRGHAERQLMRAVRRIGARVLEIYSELEPCSAPGGYCASALREYFPDAEVTYSFRYGGNPHDPDQAAQGVAQLRQAVQALFSSRGGQ